MPDQHKIICLWPVCLVIVVLGGVFMPAFGQEGSRPSPRYSPSLPNSASIAPVYLDLSIEPLKHAVPALKGISIDSNDSSQHQLDTILAGVAKSIATALPRVPNLISREDVYHFQTARDPSAAGGQANAQPWSREFRYLILSHHEPNGEVWIEENRADSKGHPIDPTGPVTAPRGLGFAYQWLLFSAANQSEFRFRYLGQQTKDGRKTYVLAFAQDPGKVSTPANFQSGDKVAHFFFQGVLWVDQSTFEIVLLRTSLLAPVPSVNLRELTTELHFSAVRIHGAEEPLWLPHEVDISSDEGAGPAEENHRYSDYHLFTATSRLLPAQ